VQDVQDHGHTRSEVTERVAAGITNPAAPDAVADETMEEFTMRKMIPVLIASSALACGASYPAPTQRMADAQSAERSARELGAQRQPKAELHLKLAQEQIAAASRLINDGDNERATFVLARAKADAELAVALAREENARAEAQRAVDQANSALPRGANQGAR